MKTKFRIYRIAVKINEKSYKKESYYIADKIQNENKYKQTINNTLREKGCKK